MAFFRNYSNDTVSHNVLDENEERQNAATFQSSPLNEDVDGTYSERGFDMNMDVQYQSDPEPGCSIRQPNETAVDNVADPVDSHYQSSTKRLGVTGRWGSTFWKDCQPMGQREGSDPAKDSQSGYKEAYHSEDNHSNDRSEKLDSENENDNENEEEDNEMNKHQSGQADVPADEMLSDEYYEQDEDNQSDHVHYKGYSNPTNSRSLPKAGSAVHSNSRTSRAIHKNIHYSDSNHDHNGDADMDYEEEEDEDDPEDADFEPYDAADDGGASKKV
jgi:chromodomain-helicase-DNA-binding protein 1